MSVDRPKLWNALTLTVLSPGVGVLYFSGNRKGARVCILWICTIILSFYLWAIAHWHSDVVLGCLIGAWFSLVIFSILDAVEYSRRVIPKRRKRSRLRRRAPSILPYLALAILPLMLSLVLFSVTRSRLIFFVSIQGQQMFPQMLPKDIVAIDRQAYQEQVLPLGALVAFSCYDRDEVQLGRIIAVAKGENRPIVKVDHGVVSLNRETLNVTPVSVHIRALNHTERVTLDSREFALEYPATEKGIPYLISEPKEKQSMFFQIPFSSFLIIGQKWTVDPVMDRLLVHKF